jgi:hypothetical protein
METTVRCSGFKENLNNLTFGNSGEQVSSHFEKKTQ